MNSAASVNPVSSTRIEHASLNAWPALHQVLHDGWLLRFCGGFTKRANSVSVLTTGQQTMEARIAFCEALYEQHGQTTVFRLTSDGPEPGLDALLAARGYAVLDRTDVLTANAEALLERNQLERNQLERDQLERDQSERDQSERDQPIALSREAWLAHYTRLSGSPASATRLHDLLLASIRLPCLFGVTMQADTVVACGLAVCEADLVGLFDIVTSAEHRSQGHGERLTAGLIAWGAAQGARTAYLQVLEANAPAQRLYHRLGFGARYRYWYRTAPCRSETRADTRD